MMNNLHRDVRKLCRLSPYIVALTLVMWMNPGHAVVICPGGSFVGHDYWACHNVGEVCKVSNADLLWMSGFGEPPAPWTRRVGCTASIGSGPGFPPDQDVFWLNYSGLKSACESHEQFNRYTLQCESGGKNAGPPLCPNGTNPINAGTGNKYQMETDYRGSGPFPLVFRRHYNSRIGEREATRLGLHWRSDFDRSIQPSGVSELTAERPDGKVYTFAFDGLVWRSDADVTDRLVTTIDEAGVVTGWEYIGRDDTVETYDNTGRLISISDRAGLTQTLVYDEENKLETVTDPFGRTLTFHYDSAGRMSMLLDPEGQSINYAYDVEGNLSVVTYPDDNTRTYLYENTRFTHALTGLVDESGNRFATWRYDEKGRATLSEHGDGAERVTVTYGTNGSATLTDSLGQARTYRFDVIQGVVKTTEIEGGPCTTCGGQAAAEHDRATFGICNERR